MQSSGSYHKILVLRARSSSWCLPQDSFCEELHLLANHLGGLLKGWTLNGPQGRQAQMHGLEALDELWNIDAGPECPALFERGKKRLEQRIGVPLHLHHVRKEALGIHEHLCEKHTHEGVIWLLQTEVQKNVIGKDAMRRTPSRPKASNRGSHARLQIGDECHHNVFLCGEIVVDGPLADIGSRGNFVDRYGIEAATRKEVNGRGQYLRPDGDLLSFASRCDCSHI